MTGQVLIYEDPRLIERVSRLHLALEAGLKLSYRTAVAEGALPADFDASGRASLLMASVLGQWQRFVLTGFKVRPLKSSSDTELFLKLEQGDRRWKKEVADSFAASFLVSAT